MKHSCRVDVRNSLAGDAFCRLMDAVECKFQAVGPQMERGAAPGALRKFFAGKKTPRRLNSESEEGEDRPSVGNRSPMNQTYMAGVGLCETRRRLPRVR